MDFSVLINPKTAALASAIIALIALGKKLWAAWFATPVGQRLLPFLPIALGALASIAPGLGLPAVDGATWYLRLEHGLVAGLVAAAGYKLGWTSVAGKGINDLVPAVSVPSGPPAAIPVVPPSPPVQPPPSSPPAA
jgi:hypothetical protein